MEELPLMFGIVAMLIAAIGIVLYVALVIAIPICRMLDWFSGEPTSARNPPSYSPNIIALVLRRLSGRARSLRSDKDDDR
jgi:hypothetical protein